MGQVMGLKRQHKVKSLNFAVSYWFCWWPEVELNHRHTDFQSDLSHYYWIILG